MAIICVFDLDGTLWEENSHVEIVGKYRYGKFYSVMRPFEKIIAHFRPKEYQKYLNASFEKIPVEFVKTYPYQYRNDALKELEKRRKEGNSLLILSNAPPIVAQIAAKKVQVEYLSAEIGEKDKALIKRFPRWDKLVVVTDNLSDANLLLLADEAIIYTPRKRKKKFETLGLKKTVCYRSSILK